MPDRLRRLRRTPSLRRLVREVSVEARHLVYPVFMSETATQKEPISSMPGQFRWPLAQLEELVNSVLAAKLGGVLLFGLPAAKDAMASGAHDENGVVQAAIRQIKELNPELVVMTDVCVCEYTDHGHCGVLNGDAVDNDLTLALLAKTALSHARAGADIVAPSSMMDRQVGAIRDCLDANGYFDTAVMGYSAKFASGYYGPFREAADSAPAFGDRASYQHDAANRRHSFLEVEADIAEGADIVMVKPGLAYLDLLRDVREGCDLPVAVYNVSGEFAMVKAAAERGWLDEKRIVLENLTAFRRAGADIILTYHALEASKWLNES